MDEKVIKDLEKLDKEIKNAQEDKARLEGRLETLYGQLKEEFDIDTIEGAEKRLREIKAVMEEKSKQIDEQYTALKEGYEW